MRILSRASIDIAQRQRTEIIQTDLLDLKASILKFGLLHPPVFAELDGRWRLVAGERRLRAIDSIAEDETFFLCNGQTILPGEVPITLVTELTAEDLFEAELDENIKRVDLSWQDRVKALAALHRMRLGENPKQTYKATADEIIAKTSSDTSAPKHPTYVGSKVREASVIAEHLSDPKVSKARNATEAFQLALQAEEAQFAAELHRRRGSLVQATHEVLIRCGDSRLILPELDAGQFDLILTDPPYGLGANTGSGYRSRTVHHHNYDDSPENAKEILKLILTEGFRVAKAKANLFIFTDIMHWDFLQTFSKQMGWTPWRYPVIWQKSEFEGLVPWGRNGFAHTYDIIFFATKGRRGTVRPNVDILNFKRVARKERVYAAEKPIDLLSLLIELTTLPNDRVLDPCCGSGSTLVAAKALRRHALGIEVDSSVVDLATTRLMKGEEVFAQSLEEEANGQEEEDQESGEAAA